VSITANAIDVTLENHRMSADGSVKTVSPVAEGQAGSKMPGLLEIGQAVNVNAEHSVRRLSRRWCTPGRCSSFRLRHD